MRIAFYMAGLLFSLIFHERAHAWVAYKLGDPTGKAHHRLSWNPVHHLDPFMSFLLPLLTYLGSGIPFGGARPVIINPMNFRNPSLGWALSAAAGPLSNLLLAVLAFIALVALHGFAPSALYDPAAGRITFNALFLGIMVNTNLFLAAFNILPLPQLDGSRVLRFFLPRAGQAAMDRIEPYGLMITLLFVTMGVSKVLRPIFNLEVRMFLLAFDDPTFTLALLKGVLGIDG